MDANNEQKRNDRRSIIGKVVSASMEKTIVVRVERLEKHAKYGKYMRRFTKYYAHDEKSEARAGDTVELIQTRPLSKTKRWRLVQVIDRAPVLEDAE